MWVGVERRPKLQQGVLWRACPEEESASMANNVANVGKVTGAIGGVALAGRLGMLLRTGWMTGRRATDAALSPSAVTSATAELGAPSMDGTLTTAAASALVARGPIVDIVEHQGVVMTANYADDAVAVLAPRTLHPVAEIAEIYEPSAIAVAGKRAYVSSVEPAYDTITVIEHGAVETRIPVDGSVRDLTVSPDGAYLYAVVIADEGPQMAVIDTRSCDLVAKVDLGVGALAVPVAVAAGPIGDIVYVAMVDDSSGLLLAVRGKDVLGALPVPSMIRDIAVTADAVFVASDDEEFGGLVDVIDTATMQVARTIELGRPMSRITLSADGARAYVVNGERVSVLSTTERRVIEQIEVGSDPAAAVESADRTRVLVAGNDGRVTAFALDAALPELGAQVPDAPAWELQPV